MQRKIVKARPSEKIIQEKTNNCLVLSQCYIGKKGYTIPKTAFTTKELDLLKEELVMVPITHGTPPAGAELSFPVYRENKNKIYIPRFYGIEKYGLPPKCEISMGQNIDIPFTGQLRDYQENVVNIFVKSVTAPICSEEMETKGNGGLIQLPCGRGKCLAKDTKIIMYDGTIKPVQDIRIGDKIMGDDSKPRNIISLARGRETMYKIHTDNDNGYTVNESHILSLMRKNKDDTMEIIDISVKEFLVNQVKYYNENITFYGYRVPIKFQKRKVSQDPYEFGTQLGQFNNLGNLENESETQFTIPSFYKFNCQEIQRELLAGIIDTMAIIKDNGYMMCFLNKMLIKEIIFVARCLGLRIENKYNKYLYITGDELYKIPVKKLAHAVKTSNKHDLLYVIRVERLQEGDYYGFEIDGNRRFVLGDFTVTHNTVIALKIISVLRKKTLIIVHKEFLMNQWIERIREFIPTAKIGKIQATVCDVENKDIVIGMVQTLYNKDFEQSIYDQFGFVVVDEVHRISSEQFSKTLFKTIAPYMLGISATIKRKDGLEKVLDYFIGNVVYSEEREMDDIVTVRAIHYQTNDNEFNEVETDFRGKVKYSTMISKLCAFVPRSVFIIRLIRDLIDENPDKQIMILAHNRCLLTFLHDAIQEEKIATTGYYVGGMKEAKLKETETKQIVIATYSMASEALDIKSLSTLVMVTPKTDIIQSVGRILRVKHENPLIVDLIDPHDVFQNQWKKRRQYYKKCNYRILSVDSKDYTLSAMDGWKTINEPKTAKTTKTTKKIAGKGDDTDDDDGKNEMTLGSCMISTVDFETE
jgi:superfamily II DNA or RNA helicase